jgi:hypothetical protein
MAIADATNGDLAVALRPVLAAIEGNDPRRAAAALRTLAPIGLLPDDWIRRSIDALEQGDYDILSAPFIKQEFIGPAGHFLIAAPYVLRREGGEHVQPSVLLGQVIEHQPTRGIADAIEAIQRAPLRQPVQAVLPVERLSAGGNLGNEQGEAFVVPDGWAWKDSAFGVALNDMAEQGRRFEQAGRRCIRRIFDADTAELLLAPLDPALGIGVRHRSYEIHDAGHSSGLGLVHKVRDNLMPGFWYRAIEEWRSDGVGFEVGAGLLGEEAAGHDVASNFCVRFGIDAHRAGGLDGDSDVGCSLLIVDRLLREGELLIRGGRLALRDLSYGGLVRAMEAHRYEAIALTRKELALERPSGLQRLYGTLHVHRASEAILEGLIREPCRGFFESLR